MTFSSSSHCGNPGGGGSRVCVGRSDLVSCCSQFPSILFSFETGSLSVDQSARQPQGSSSVLQSQIFTTVADLHDAEDQAQVLKPSRYIMMEPSSPNVDCILN